MFLHFCLCFDTPQLKIWNNLRKITYPKLNDPICKMVITRIIVTIKCALALFNSLSDFTIYSCSFMWPQYIFSSKKYFIIAISAIIPSVLKGEKSERSLRNSIGPEFCIGFYHRDDREKYNFS